MKNKNNIDGDLSRYLNTARNADYVVGIDPDCEKSGYAMIDKRNGKMTLASYTFVELIRHLKELRDGFDGLRPWVVVVEAGYLEAKAQHHYFGENPRIAARVGIQVGRNHETARKIIEICKDEGIPVEERAPLRKIWKGRDGKITAEEFNALTGYTKRTSQDVRDAALLAWVSAGYNTDIKKR